MQKLEKIINNDFQDILRSPKNPKYHIFFDSHEWYLEVFGGKKPLNEYTEKLIKEINTETDTYELNIHSESELDKIKPVNNCNYIPKKVMSHEMLIDNYKLLVDSEENDFNKIKAKLDDMRDYNLPSTINNLQMYLKKIKKDEVLNIVIAGAGPVGLFTALYLQHHYNRNYLGKRVNILLLDNRIYKEGLKLPYSRVTQFGFHLKQYVPFLNQIFCWQNRIMNEYSDRQFDFVYILENLLFLAAYAKNIPMYFTKKYETYDKLKNFAVKNNFNFIMDCTGGRLGAVLKNKVQWNDYNFKKGQYEVKYIGDNIYRFYSGGKEYEHLTVVLHLLNNNKKPILVGNAFGTVINKNDEKIVKKYGNKCYLKNDYVKISQSFQYKGLRYLLPINMKSLDIKDRQVKYVHFTYFNSNSHHLNRVAQVIKKDLMYVAMGNTLGSSEYGIYFGMKNGVAFAEHVCNLLTVVDNL